MITIGFFSYGGTLAVAVAHENDSERLNDRLVAGDGFGRSS